jgi:hypothetical protein
MRGMRPSETGRPDPDRVPTTASFDNRLGQTVELTLREVSTRADEVPPVPEAVVSSPEADS